MCRISGLVHSAYSPEKLKSLVKEMCNVLKAGGPDAEGLFLNEGYNLCIGHRRLSLIDLSERANQPMQYADGRYQITYNGEIYNFIEIRKILMKSGHQFKTDSDTEVILAAYAEWGINGFRRFNGMFAFAIWDNQTGELSLPAMRWA